MDLLRGQIDGSIALSPALRLLNLGLRHVALGRVGFEYRPEPSHMNEAGVVDAGVLAALLQAALHSAARSTLPAAQRLRTLTLHVHLVRDLPLPAAPLTLDARVVHGGRRLLTAEARLRDANGSVHAHGSATLAVQPIATKRVDNRVDEHSDTSGD